MKAQDMGREKAPGPKAPSQRADVGWRVEKTLWQDWWQIRQQSDAQHIYHYGVANEVCTESSAQPCSKAEAWSTPNTKCWQRCAIQARASIAGWTRTQYSHCKTVWGCSVSDALNIGSSNQSPWYLFVSPKLCIVPSKFQDVRHN